MLRATFFIIGYGMSGKELEIKGNADFVVPVLQYMKEI
jgi:hypothetical protein